ARCRAGGRADRGSGFAPRDPAPGCAQGWTAAAERLRRAAEGRGSDLDPRPPGGFPDRSDRTGADLQLHPAGRGRVALSLRHRAAGPGRRPDGRRRAGAMSAGAPVLELRGVTKAFGEREVLRGIDLTVNEHEAIALIGASGSGKSTLLRCIDLL